MWSMKRKCTKLSDQLRKLIEASGESCNQISREAGIDKATLSRFMNGKGGLSTDGLDRIADYLGLNLTAENEPLKPKGR